MKIKNYAASLQEKMSEFDMWVTPSLGEIRDTPQFKTNLNQLKTGFDQLAEITDNFSSIAFVQRHHLQKEQFSLSVNSMKLRQSPFLTTSAMCFYWRQARLTTT